MGACFSYCAAATPGDLLGDGGLARGRTPGAASRALTGVMRWRAARVPVAIERVTRRRGGRTGVCRSVNQSRGLQERLPWRDGKSRPGSRFYNHVMRSESLDDSIGKIIHRAGKVRIGGGRVKRTTGVQGAHHLLTFIWDEPLEGDTQV
jgi:hypothetical protein